MALQYVRLICTTSVPLLYHLTDGGARCRFTHILTKKTDTDDMADIPQLMRTGRACKVLAVSRNTLRTMIDDGTLEAVRLGPKSLRVYERSVLKVLGVKGTGND